MAWEHENPNQFYSIADVNTPSTELIDLGMLYDHKAPITLDPKDIFEAFDSLSGNPIKASRIYYLPNYECYVIGDREQPRWFHLLDAETKLSFCRFCVDIDSTGYTHVIDMTVFSTRDDTKVSIFFLMGDAEQRCMSVVAFEIDMREFVSVEGRKKLTLTYSEPDLISSESPINLPPYVSRWNIKNEPIMLNLEDIVSFHDIVTPGLNSGMVIGTTETNYDFKLGTQGTRYRAPRLNFEGFIARLNRSPAFGALDFKYCSIVAAPSGRLYILVQSRITVAAGPFLTEYPKQTGTSPVTGNPVYSDFPLFMDVQYLVVTDFGGNPIKYILAGPSDRIFNFNEGITDQPYSRWLNIIDGADIVMVEDRYERQLALEYVARGNPHDGYVYTAFCNKTWTGGWLHGVWFDARPSTYDPNTTEDGLGLIYIGYPSQWETENMIPDPEFRATVWNKIVCTNILSHWPLSELKQTRPMKLTPAINAIETATISHSLHFIYQQGDKIFHGKINYLAVYFGEPEVADVPQSSIYIPSLIPGEAFTATYYMKNLARTGTARNIVLTIDPDFGVPAGLAITFHDFPDDLAPDASAAFSITVVYTPPSGATPFATTVIPLKLEYLMKFDF